MIIRPMLKQLAGIAVQAPLIGSAVTRFYEHVKILPGLERKHPFDVLNGVRTSGFVPGFALPTDATGYSGAIPSIVRRALATIPESHDCHFIDLGCGKGRPLLIATEFQFASITGVEYFAPLADIARRNARIFERKHPGRVRINVVTGDATAFSFPTGKIVIFLFNPFEGPAMTRALANIEASLRETPRDLYVVYYNPVCADVFDSSPLLERRIAAQLTADPSEIGCDPHDSYAVVVWQNRGNSHPRPPGNATAPVKLSSRWVARIEESALN